MKERERTKAPTFLPVPHPAHEFLSQGRAERSPHRQQSTRAYPPSTWPRGPGCQTCCLSHKTHAATLPPTSLSPPGPRAKPHWGIQVQW